MSKVLYLFLWFAFIISACQNPDAQLTEEKPPNFVFLFADDYSYRALGALGNTQIQTPNLDRLAKQGTQFTHVYNMGGWHGAVCVASRSMLISGRYLWPALEQEKRWTDRDSQAIAQTWGRVLQQHGYETYMSGKWHTRAPVEEVFENLGTVRPGGMPGDAWEHFPMLEKFKSAGGTQGVDLDQIMPVGYNRPKNERDTSWSPHNPRFGGFWEGGTHWSEVIKNDGLLFLEDALKKERPYFMYLAFNAPHDPRQAPKEFVDLYPVDNIELPASFAPQHPWMDSIGVGPWLRDEALAPYPRTPYAVKTHLQEYYAIISHLDAQIGELMDTLEARDQLDNTYLIFTGDHGLSVGRHGLMGKQNMYDHSLRVPLIIAGPGIPKNKKVETDVYLQSIMPTTLDLANIPIPGYVQFGNLMPLINGNTASGHPTEAVYGAYVNYQRMIRRDGYKLIIYPRAGQRQLFDLKNDPEELNNLIDSTEHQDRTQQLMADLKKLQVEMEDPLVVNR